MVGSSIEQRVIMWHRKLEGEDHDNELLRYVWIDPQIGLTFVKEYFSEFNENFPGPHGLDKYRSALWREIRRIRVNK